MVRAMIMVLQPTIDPDMTILHHLVCLALTDHVLSTPLLSSDFTLRGTIRDTFTPVETVET